MDNITLRFSDVKFDFVKLSAFLKKKKARESSKPDGVILFTRKVGKHKSGWQFTLDISNKSILCSGGPTSTFFGFNAWVSLKHGIQMETIVNILRRKLEEMDGVELSDQVPPTVHRVEITNLYRFNSIEEIALAETALYSSLVVRYPGKVMVSGASMEVPGMIRVGLNKSSTTLRIYPEELKLESKPAHVGTEVWIRMCAELKNCLRVECIFNNTQLKSAGLDSTLAWNNPDQPISLEKLVEGRMSEAGLRNLNPQSLIDLESYLAKSEESKVRDVLARWKDNKSLDVNGTWSKAQKKAKAMGFDLTHPFAYQKQLAHGLYGKFDATQVVVLSIELRRNAALFEHWWEDPKAQF
jgi:hypothetical protein